MKLTYGKRRFKPEALAVIGQVNAIVEDYQEQGFDLTLRQLYYQFVSRGWLANKQTEYKRLGSIVNDGRLSGLIDWEAIVDRTRNLEALSHWESPADIVESAAQAYRIDRWADQDRHVEVWIEKDALTGVIEGICKQWDVGYFSCRGYASQSEVWGAGQRFLEALTNDRSITVLHLGDHDPSGLDMTRDIESRLERFLIFDFARHLIKTKGKDVKDAVAVAHDIVPRRLHVDRIALNMDQIEQYAPPPNPAKLTDSRAAGYIGAYGDESWELDALDPPVLVGLIDEAIGELVDQDLYDEAVAREESAKDRLRELAGTLA